MIPARRSQLPTILRLVLIALALASAAQAQPPQGPWTPFGPGGGPVVSLAVDPGDAAVVYAVAGFGSLSSGVLYKSADGGITWQGLKGFGLRLVAVAPDRPSTVYAGGPFTTLRSTNGGHTWSELTLPLGRSGVNALAAAPGGVVFAGNQGLLLRSGNSGGTWTAVTGDGSGVVSIQVDPSDSGHVYYASATRVYESADGGLHWSLTGQPAAGGISAFALAPSDPDRLYALWYADGRIFRSDDGARTWQVVGQVPTGGVPALAVDPGSPDRVYVANGVGLFRSEDGGGSWQPAFNGLPRFLDQPPAVFTVAAAPSRPGVLYAGTSDGGVARSVDSGGHWRAGLQLGLNATFTTLLKFNPLRPTVVYLGQGSFGDRSYRSTDGGRTWQGFARAVTQQGWNDLAFDPVDPDRLYAATNTAIWRSGDSGESWERISDQNPLKLAAPGGQTLLASRCGMSRSTDGGRTWREVIACNGDHGSPRYPLSLWSDPRDPRAVYVHFVIFGSGSVDSRYEIFRSRDGGATWTKPAALKLPYLFAVAPGDSRILYAVDGGFQPHRLLRSLDGGDHWTVVSRSFTADQHGLYAAMAVDAADPDTLYLAAKPLQVSHDGGATFRAVNAPFELGKTAAGPLWTDRARPGLLYADAIDGGLFVGRFQ
jgi:photosystem II stability/assembly factor-like uncharacterized protein